MELSQQVFEFKLHGGRRKNAGRKKIKLNEPKHIPRDAVTKHLPFHCGVRMHADTPNLRCPALFAVITKAFKRALTKGLRVTEFSIEGNHIHFLAEAESKTEISKGLMSITASITWGLRKLYGYYGPVFEKRYFLHVISKPREMLHALLYVMFNHANHLKVAKFIDLYSSAAAYPDIRLFVQQKNYRKDRIDQIKSCTCEPRSWLHRSGWRKWM